MVEMSVFLCSAQQQQQQHIWSDFYCLYPHSHPLSCEADRWWSLGQYQTVITPPPIITDAKPDLPRHLMPMTPAVAIFKPISGM